MFSWFKKDRTASYLGELLTLGGMKEDLLGTKAVRMPDERRIREDASMIARYSRTSDYQVFARETWARVLQSLDIVLDDKSSDDKVKFHRGAIKASLDLLRLSAQARSVMEEMDREKEQNVSSAR
jgi:hypothetical protein